MDWTPALVARLRELKGQKLSHALIARTLSEEFKLSINKNKVCGAVRRSGLSDPRQMPKGISAYRLAQAAKRTLGSELREQAFQEFIAASFGGKPAPETCSYILGRPEKENVRFCGKPCKPYKLGERRKPFCEDHARIVYKSEPSKEKSAIPVS